VNRFKSVINFLHVLKDAKPQTKRVLLESASDNLIKEIVECAINTQNGNHKVSKEGKGKLSNYKNRLRTLINQKISFNCNSKRFAQRGRFIVPLVTSILSGVEGATINNNN
jgi:hypothetical protein